MVEYKREQMYNRDFKEMSSEIISVCKISCITFCIPGKRLHLHAEMLTSQFPAITCIGNMDVGTSYNVVAKTMSELYRAALRKKATVHQVTTMLATSKNILFPGHNHLLTTGTDDWAL